MEADRDAPPPAGAGDVSLFHNARSGSGAHLASCTMGTGGGGCSAGESSRGLKLATLLHLMPRLRMVDVYLHSPIRLLGLVLN
jgi:hypothetical protein